MSTAADIDREIADLYERLALLHRRRADASRVKPRKLPVVPVERKPSEEAVDDVRRSLRRKGVVA